MEIRGMLFNMRGERHQVIVDEPRGLIVLVRFGFQPNTSTSSRCGAEIDQQGFLVRLRFRERRVCIFQPIYFHDSAPQLIEDDDASLQPTQEARLKRGTFETGMETTAGAAGIA